MRLAKITAALGYINPSFLPPLASPLFLFLFHLSIRKSPPPLATRPGPFSYPSSVGPISDPQEWVSETTNTVSARPLTATVANDLEQEKRIRRRPAVTSKKVCPNSHYAFPPSRPDHPRSSAFRTRGLPFFFFFFFFFEIKLATLTLMGWDARTL